MNEGIRFQNDFVLYNDKYENIKQKIFELLKKELPDEAQTFEIVSFVFDELKGDLKNNKINL